MWKIKGISSFPLVSGFFLKVTVQLNKLMKQNGYSSGHRSMNTMLNSHLTHLIKTTRYLITSLLSPLLIAVLPYSSSSVVYNCWPEHQDIAISLPNEFFYLYFYIFASFVL